MVSRAKVEKRQKYAFGKTRKNGENQPTKKYSYNHWLNTHNDYRRRAWLFPQKQARETLHGLILWLGRWLREMRRFAGLMITVFSL